MRTLKFIVDSKGLRKDPNCNFSGFHPGAETRVQAHFSFSREWDETTVKVAGFWVNGVECSPQVLASGITCMIPERALNAPAFDIRIFGKKNKSTIKTNLLRVRLNGGAI